jgi:iron complex outermembrane receptor protein
MKQLSLEELGNVQVTTASKEPEILNRTPAAVSVLTSEDIRRSGATSLPEILRLVPGVQVARIDSDHWAVGVRGFANQFSQSLLVLVDGRSLYTPLFAGVYWSVQDTLLEDVERIEVIRGPGGTIWGANAVNGVINIITKRAKDTHGLVASASTGTLDHAIAGVRFGGGRHDAFDYRVYAKGFDRGAEFHSDGQDFDSWRTGQGGVRADWESDRDQLTLQGDLYKGSHGQSVAYGSFSPLTQIVAYDPVALSGGNLLAHWRRSLGSRGDLQVQAYYDRTSLIGPQIGESRHTFDVDFIHRLASVPRHQITWGFGARLSPSEIIQTVPTLDVLPHDTRNSVYSSFAQDEIAILANRVWLTIGAKLERNNYTGVEVQPSVRILWTPTQKQSVWSGITRAVRTPSMLEEGIQLTGFLAATPPTFVRIVGNKEFASERVIGVEAGYRIAPSPLFYVDFAAFHNDHDNLQSLGKLSTAVETTPSPAHLLLIFPYANGVMGTSDGFEVATTWQLARVWQANVSYAYLHIDLTNKAGNTDTSAVATYEGSSASHQVIARSSFTLARNWQLDPTLRYASALPAQKVSAYAALDVRIGWQFRDGLTMAVVGQNLTDDHHQEFGHAPPPAVALKRSAHVTLTWTR